MNRREFFRRAALVAAGAVAADQLELLERLAPRRLFAAWPTTQLRYTTVRTGLPSVVWRQLNQGVSPVKPSFYNVYNTRNEILDDVPWKIEA